MSYPENPSTIVLKNKYYQSGIREIDLWNYYQSVKVPLIKEVINRDLMFVILVDVNKPVIRRKLKSGSIKLTPDNYDLLMGGRTLSIHSTMSSVENFAIVDVDVTEYDGLTWAKETTLRVYDYLMDKVPIIRKATIRFTGKTSFHIICEFNKKNKIESSKFLLEKFLRESPLSKLYTINAKKATAGVPNLDLNRNCRGCNYITLHSLSLFGLKCMEVPYNNLSTFSVINAKI